MKPKKSTLKLSYNSKKSIINDPTHLDTLKRIHQIADSIHLVEENFYDDDSESVTIQFHFTKAKLEKKEKIKSHT